MKYLRFFVFITIAFLSNIINAKQLEHIKIIEVIISSDATSTEKYYADILANSLRKKFPKLYVIVETNNYYTGNNYKIFLEHNPTIAEEIKELKSIIADTIKISSNKKFTKISYSNSTCVALAVNEFLDKYLDVKYMTPSILGEEYQQDTVFDIDFKDYKITPSYYNRFYGIYQKNTHIYSSLSGQNSVLNLVNHNITRTTKNISIKENPNFFPLIAGKRRDYDYSRNIQMNLLDKDFQEYIANQTINYFDKNKSAKVYSICYADSFLFDQSQETTNLINGYTPTGYVNYSDVVFTFTNAVAKMVQKQYPDKFVGELGYLYTELPPTFKLNDNIVIYLCADRTNHYDNNLKQIDVDLQKAWANSGVKLWGIYNYLYGKGYGIPANTEFSISDSIKTCYNLGGRLYTGETYPIWAYDAHKIWLMTKLLNNVNLDAQKLQSNFFKDYYKEASPYIEQFFEIAKSAWINQEATPIWLKAFTRPSQFDIFEKEDLKKMQRALSKAEITQTSKKVKDRIFEIRLVFDITLAMFDIYNYNKFLSEFEPKSIDDCYIILDRIEALRIATIRKNLALNRYQRNTKYPKSNFKFFDESNFIDMKNTALEKTYNIADKQLKDKLRIDFGNVIFDNIEAIKNYKIISRNSDFKERLKNWVQFRPNDNIKIFELTNENTLKLSSQNFVGISQTLNIKANHIYGINAKIKGKLNIGNIVYIRLNFFDKNRNLLESHKQQLPSSKTELNTLRIIAKSPANAIKCSMSLFVGSTSIDESIEVIKFELVEAVE